MIGSRRGVPCQWDVWAGPALLEDQPAPQPCRPEWAERGKLGWRGQTTLAAETSCGFHSTRIYLGCLQLPSLPIWFYYLMSEAEEDFRLTKRRNTALHEKLKPYIYFVIKVAMYQIIYVDY